MSARWTNVERATIRDQYERVPLEQLQAMLPGRSLMAIFKEASRQGLGRAADREPVYPIPASELPMIRAFNAWPASGRAQLVGVV